MITTQKISLDFACLKTQPRVSAVQGDSYSRAVEVSLYENGKDWNVPDGASVMVRYRRPDGTGDLYDTLPDGTTACSVTHNVLTVILSPQMLAVPGLVTAQLQIVREEETLATFSFGILVERDPSAGVPESEETVSWTNWTLKEMERMITEAVENGDFTGPEGPQGEKGDKVELRYQSGKLQWRWVSDDGNPEGDWQELVDLGESGIDVAEEVAENDSRPVSSAAVYAELESVVELFATI